MSHKATRCLGAFVLAATIAPAMTACMTVYEPRARARAASDLGCPERAIKTTYLGSGGWLAAGCGQAVTYACDRAHGGAPFEGFCIREGSVTSMGPPSRDARGPTLDRKGAYEVLDDVAIEADRVCRSDPGPRGQGQAHVTFERDGRVAGVILDPPFASTRLGDCVANQFRRAVIAPFDDLPVVFQEEFVINDRSSGG